MPVGPNGEKRPDDTVQNAVTIMKIATGQIEEKYVPRQKQNEKPKRDGARGNRTLT